MSHCAYFMCPHSLIHVQRIFTHLWAFSSQLCINKRLPAASVCRISTYGVIPLRNIPARVCGHVVVHTFYSVCFYAAEGEC